MPNIQITSLNVRGLRGNKRYGIFQWLRQKKYDVCFLQETFCTDDFTTKCNKGWSGNIVHSTSNSKHSRGVCIMFRKEFEYEIIDIHPFQSGRGLLMNVNIAGNIFSLINIYCPNDMMQRISFFSNST